LVRVPLYWTIDSRERLMTAVAEGAVRKEEAEAYLEAMAGAKAGAYRRLFDGSHAEPLMSDQDIMELAVRMRGLQELGKSGPLAVVMPGDKYERFARMLGILAVPDRPLRFFSSAEAAREWLDAPEIRDWPLQESAQAH
jgi:hypothetical protein